MGGVFDEPDESPKTAERPRQVPMEVDSSRYMETGTLKVVEDGPGGLPQVVGDEPVVGDVGLTYANLVCTEAPGRRACEHYVAILIPADGEAKGFGPMRQIRRFCKRLSTASELFEITGQIYGCSARSPEDGAAVQAVRDFEQRQREHEAEAAQTQETVEL
jgi:hypothetical protein